MQVDYAAGASTSFRASASYTKGLLRASRNSASPRMRTSTSGSRPLIADFNCRLKVEGGVTLSGTGRNPLPTS